MSDPANPASPPIETEWQPPSTPPIPPFDVSGASSSAGGDRGLTAVQWSLGVSSALIAAMLALTVAAGILAGVVREAGVEGPALTIVLGGALGVGYVAILGIVWLMARSHDVGFREAVGMRPASAGAFVAGVLMATVVGRVAAGIWGAALQTLEIDLPGQDIDPSRLFPPGVVGVTTAFLVAVVLAPLAEEVVFRGVLLSSLDRRWGSTAAVVVSSALFAAMHVSPYAIPPIFVLSLILGWLFVRTRSLTVCVVAHAAFNGVGLAALYALKAAGVL